jgi:hypothetical protein
MTSFDGYHVAHRGQFTLTGPLRRPRGRLRLPLFVAALCALAAAAWGADYSATPSSFIAVLANAKAGGDSVTLVVPGDYPAPNLYTAKRPAPGVTVKAAAGVAARFPALSFSSSDGFAFEGVEIAGPVSVSNSTNIALRHVRIAPAPNVSGFVVRRSIGVSLEDSEVTGGGLGVSFYDNPVGGLKLLRTHIHDISGPDAIDSYSSSNVLIADNLVHDILQVGTSHPDVIQVDSPVAGGTRSAHVTITGNRYYKGFSVGAVSAQGIFVGHADDLTIVNNGLSGTMQNGISLADVHGARVEDNFATAQATVRGASDSVTFRRNVAFTFQDYAPVGTAPNTNVVWESNTATSPGGSTDKDYLVWQHRYDVPAPPPPPVDPRERGDRRPEGPGRRPKRVACGGQRRNRRCD